MPHKYQPFGLCNGSYAYAADVSSYKDEFKANNVLDAVQNYQRTSGGATLYLNNTYGDVFSKFTLQSSEEYSSLYPEKRTVSYRYDSKWNPVEVTTPDNMSVVYLWGYKYSLPIARLKGITYAEVVSRLGTTVWMLCVLPVHPIRRPSMH